MKRGKSIAVKTAAVVMGASMLGGVLVPALPAMAAGKTKTMHVLTDVVSKDGTENYQFTYNKKGLIKKEKTSSSVLTNIYRYRALRESVYKSMHGDNSNINFYYNQKAQVAKTVTKVGKAKDVVTYTYDSKDRVKKIVENDATGTQKRVVTYKYKYNKKDQVTKVVAAVQYGDTKSKQILTYKYNKKGDVKKLSTEGYTWKYDYTYAKDGKRWKKAVVTSSAPGTSEKYTTVYKYKYKKVQVPTDRVGQVLAQQEQTAKSSGFGFLYASLTAL